MPTRSPTTKPVDAVADLRDETDDLMSGDERNLREVIPDFRASRQLAVDDVQIGPADAAREDLDQQLARQRDRQFALARFQPAGRRLRQHHGSHSATLIIVDFRFQISD